MNTKTKITILLVLILLGVLIYTNTLPKQNAEVSLQPDEILVEQTENEDVEQVLEEMIPLDSEPTAVQPRQTNVQTAPVTPATSPKIPSNTSATPVPASIPTISKDAMKKYWDVVDTSKLALTLNQIDLYNSINAKQITCDINTVTCKDKIKAQLDVYENIDQNDYVYGWEDARQAILSTDMYKMTVRGNTYYAKDFLYFYINKDGKRSILAYHTSSLETNSSVEAKLLFTDTDYDSLGTVREKCETPYKNDPTCFVSDPSIRDTDGDGWWDGLETFL